MCRRYEPNGQDVMNILFICEDPRDSDEIETREQLNGIGQQLLRDFENGVTSAEALCDMVQDMTTSEEEELQDMTTSEEEELQDEP